MSSISPARHSRSVRAIAPYRNLRKTFQRDLTLVILVGLLFMIVAVKGNMMERFLLWSSARVASQLDEAMTVVMIALGGGTVFALRRWRQLQVEVRERAAAESALFASEERLERLFSSSPFPVLVLSFDDGRILACNSEFEAVTGHDALEIEGRSTSSLALWTNADFVADARTRLRDGESIRNVEVEFRDVSGGIHQALLSATSIPFGDVPSCVVALNDISDRRQLERQLEYQAYHDSLTGLPNRSLFRNRLEHALVSARRAGRRPTVLFLDLDNFKNVNDSFGHAVGDELLKAVARRLLLSVRAEDTCARFGGDEFAILIEDAVDDTEGVHLAERLLPLIRAPFVLSQTTAHIGVSVGVAVANIGETDEVLMRNADLAMYLSKTDGRGRFTVFEPSMHAEVADRLAIEADLHLALEREEFVVNYQPIVSIDTGAILSLEALVRWQHPTRGMLSPSVFIPIAESSGTIVALGQWVLQQACLATAGLQRQFPRTPPLSVSVNLSGRQIADPQVVEVIERALQDSGLPPSSLILEITESVLVHNATDVLQRMWAMKRLGIRLAIDDFGTGYSSLAYLQKFPVDILKIDKSFTDRIGTGADESPIARAVVALGSTISLQTVAEGIETDVQWQRLRELGCDRGQGFLFARPGGMGSIEDLLRTENNEGAVATRNTYSDALR